MTRPDPQGSMLPTLLGGTLVVAAFAGGAQVVFSGAGGVPPATYAALLLDASPTSRPSDRCDDAEGIAARLAEESRGPAELTVYATGHRRTDGQPLRLGRASRAPQPHLVESHTDRGPDLAFRQRARELCSGVQPTAESPLFAAVSAAVQDLSERPCSEPRVDCAVWFRTDGLEEVDPVVTAGLNASGAERSWRIDNEHVDVVFCGLAAREVRGQRGEAGDLRAVEAAFLPEFRRPERVRLLPSCPITN
jgi:hypothetical protein